MSSPPCAATRRASGDDRCRPAGRSGAGGMGGGCDRGGCCERGECDRGEGSADGFARRTQVHQRFQHRGDVSQGKRQRDYDARAERLDLERRFFGLHLGHDIALGDRIAQFDVDRHDLGLRQVLPDLGHQNCFGHLSILHGCGPSEVTALVKPRGAGRGNQDGALLCSTRRTAAITSSACGTLAPFQRQVEGNRDVQHRHDLHRRIKVIRRLFLNDRGDIRGDAAAPDGLLHDHHAVGFGHRGQDRGAVQRHQGAGFSNSHSIPSAAINSAASIARDTMFDHAMIVTSDPARLMSAKPKGTTCSPSGTKPLVM